MTEYKEMINEWVDTEYTNLWDSNEYQNIIKHLDDIVENVYDKISDETTLEDELNIVWEEINKWKN